MKIKKRTARLQAAHAAMAACALLLSALCAAGWLPQAQFDAQQRFVMEMAAVLCTIVVGGVALRAFDPLMRRCAASAHREKKILKMLCRCHLLMGVALWLSLWLCLVVCFYANTNTGLYCALMLLLLILYRFPTVSRIEAMMREGKEQPAEKKGGPAQ